MNGRHPSNAFLVIVTHRDYDREGSPSFFALSGVGRARVGKIMNRTSVANIRLTYKTQLPQLHSSGWNISHHVGFGLLDLTGLLQLSEAQRLAWKSHWELCGIWGWSRQEEEAGGITRVPGGSRPSFWAKACGFTECSSQLVCSQTWESMQECYLETIFTCSVSELSFRLWMVRQPCRAWCSGC